MRALASGHALVAVGILVIVVAIILSIVVLWTLSSEESWFNDGCSGSSREFSSATCLSWAKDLANADRIRAEAVAIETIGVLAGLGLVGLGTRKVWKGRRLPGGAMPAGDGAVADGDADKPLSPRAR